MSEGGGAEGHGGSARGAALAARGVRMAGEAGGTGPAGGGRAQAQQVELPRPTSPGVRVASLLSCERVDVGALAGAWRGLGVSAAARATAWKLLLGYLPRDSSAWADEEAARRNEYQRFVQEMVDPRLFGGRSGEDGDRGDGADGDGGEATTQGELRREAVSDDPLSQASDSTWRAFFADSEELEQIVRDVERTHPDVHFFSGLSADGEPESVSHRGGGDASCLNDKQTCMARALFVYAKLNPGIRYVQGMNELYAPLFYVFRTAPSCARDVDAEADAFFCFSTLMGEFRDHYCKQLDNSDVGVKATLARLDQMLEARDPTLHTHLTETHGVAPTLYAFRWVTLLLTQEFTLPDTLSLWDALLAEQRDRLECLLRLCVAMLMHSREVLLQGDFAACVKLLQRYPPTDVGLVIERAVALGDHS